MSCNAFGKRNEQPWNPRLLKDTQLWNSSPCLGSLSFSPFKPDGCDGWFCGDSSSSSASKMNDFTLISWLNQITCKKWVFCDVKSDFLLKREPFVSTRKPCEVLEAWCWAATHILWSAHFMRRVKRLEEVISWKQWNDCAELKGLRVLDVLYCYTDACAQSC